MNQVHLVGLVATRPRPVAAEAGLGFLVVTQPDPRGGRIDRHRVIVEPGSLIGVESFRVGEALYVQGRLGRYGDSARVAVIACEAWSIAPASTVEVKTPPIGSHGSPRQHQRVGHPRRIAIGTPRERLIWVRPTIVAGGRELGRP